MSVPLVTNSYDVGPYWQDHSASRSIDGVEESTVKPQPKENRHRWRWQQQHCSGGGAELWVSRLTGPATQRKDNVMGYIFNVSRQVQVMCRVSSVKPVSYSSMEVIKWHWRHSTECRQHQSWPCSINETCVASCLDSVQYAYFGAMLGAISLFKSISKWRDTRKKLWPVNNLLQQFNYQFPKNWVS